MSNLALHLATFTKGRELCKTFRKRFLQSLQSMQKRLAFGLLDKLTCVHIISLIN